MLKKYLPFVLLCLIPALALKADVRIHFKLLDGVESYDSAEDLPEWAPALHYGVSKACSILYPEANTTINVGIKRMPRSISSLVNDEIEAESGYSFHKIFTPLWRPSEILFSPEELNRFQHYFVNNIESDQIDFVFYLDERLLLNSEPDSDPPINSCLLFDQPEPDETFFSLDHPFLTRVRWLKTHRQGKRNQYIYEFIVAILNGEYQKDYLACAIMDYFYEGSPKRIEARSTHEIINSFSEGDFFPDGMIIHGDVCAFDESAEPNSPVWERLSTILSLLNSTLELCDYDFYIIRHLASFKATKYIKKRISTLPVANIDHLESFFTLHVFKGFTLRDSRNDFEPYPKQPYDIRQQQLYKFNPPSSWHGKNFQYYKTRLELRKI